MDSAGTADGADTDRAGDATADETRAEDTAPGVRRTDRGDTDGEARYRARTRAGRILFGDRVGLALFLGAVCFGMLFWRAGIFITDNATLARTLEALSEGRLWIERAGESPFDAPGAEVRDGRVYGRNYGQVVASLPALWLLQAVDRVADLRVALVAGWHLAALAGAVVVADLVGWRRPGTLAVAPLVVASFVVNLALATRIEQPDVALLALQLTAVLATALGAVVLYRLLAVQGPRRVAALAGTASVLVLPVGFWAAIPKRHVFTVLAVVTVLFLFALSRRPGDRTLPVLGRVPVHRAGMYAVVGLLTWIHAAEGLFVFLVLVAVDVPTAPRNDARSLAVVGVVFGLSMLPTLVTNLLVTGELLRPPRELSGGVTDPAAADPGGGDSGAGPDGGGGVLETVGDLLPVGVLAWFVRNVLAVVRDGLFAATDSGRLWHVFVRSAGADLAGSRPEFIGDLEFAGTNLSVLETAPVLALAVAAVAGWVGRLRNGDWSERVDPTVALSVALAVAFTLLYLALLPLYSQITQRYLLPVFPLALYALVRSSLVQDLVERRAGVVCWSYAGGVLVGGQLVLVSVLARDLPPSEAAQSQATLALALAALVVVTGLLTVRTRRFDRATAVAVGLACAAGTVFVAVAHLVYFAGTGEAILPVVRELTTLLDI